MADIIPAIMPQSVEDIEYKLGLIASYVPCVQLDIMDGKFVRPKTWPYIRDRGSFDALITESEGLPFWDKVDFEIDLMISNPEESIEMWIQAGAARLVVHVESTGHLEDIINLFRERFAYAPDSKSRDIELVLALNSDTPTDVVLPYLEDIDGIQFMGIAHIGYQGESFDESVFDKIRDFHNAHPEIIISIDGGVRFNNARILLDCGVNRLVSGSAIYDKGIPSENINVFKEI